jgi:hypothetical protein
MAAPVPVPADFESKEVYKRQLTANDTKERSRLYINKSPAKTFIANPNQIKIKNFNLLGATKGIFFFFFFFFLCDIGPGRGTSV